MWMGGLRERTVDCRGKQLKGVANVTVEKRGSCAYGWGQTDVAPFCGSCQCLLYRRYKIGIKADGIFGILDDAPSQQCELLPFFFRCFCCIFWPTTDTHRSYDGTIYIGGQNYFETASFLNSVANQIRSRREEIHAEWLGAIRTGSRGNGGVQDVIDHDMPSGHREDYSTVAVAIEMEDR
jgi:hypothetical protein